MATPSFVFQKLIPPFQIRDRYVNIFMLVLRLIAGYFLSFVFAANKFGTPWTPASLGLRNFEVSQEFIGIVTAFGAPFDMMPGLFAWSAGFTEAWGGILLLLGLNTRMTAFFITITMLVTIYFRVWDNSWSALPTFIFFCVGLFLMGFGSGKYGLDSYWAQKYL